jgi:hypothetical protein
MISAFKSDFTRKGGECGQTLIYILSALAVLTMAGMWMYDFNTAAASRIRAQNAADGAALAAAQWQARSLNGIGEINLIKAINTLLDNVPPGSELQSQISGLAPSAAYLTIQGGLDSLQARMGFVGPMLAMIACQQAAKNNGVPNNELFTAAIRQHATVVSSAYKDNFTSPNWGSGDWAQSYAAMLNYLADEGIAASPDNASFYGGNLSMGPEARRYLVTKAFYQAISVKNWCYLEDLLMSGYDDYSYWGSITPLPQSTSGSEYFGLGLEFTSSDSLIGAGGLSDTQFQKLRSYYVQELDRRNLPLHTDWPQFVPPIQWAIYSSSSWTNWTKAATYRTSIVGDARPIYDYSGCDAVTAVSIRNNLALSFTKKTSDGSPGASEWNSSWLVGNSGQAASDASVSRLQNLSTSGELDVKANAAAKPFGRLPDIDEPAYTFKIVLPVYQDVRLIPIALASSYGSADAQWFLHKMEHLPYSGSGDAEAYTQFGPNSLPAACFYCQQLKRWEDGAFRQEGHRP